MQDSKSLYKIFNTILIAIVFVLLFAIVLVVYAAQNQPATPQSGIKVVENPRIEAPSVIREGEVFTYRSTGNKLISAPADVRLQMICNVNGTQNIVTVATFVSNRPIGSYDDERTTAISPSSKLISSKDCKLQFAVAFTVYQTTRSNEIQPIVVTTITESNRFEFIAANPNVD